MAVEILFSVAVLLIFAKIFGEIAERMKLPALTGEITGGFIAGPLLRFVSPEPLLAELSNLGMLFVVFLLGLPINFEDKGNTKSGIVIAVLGAALSFIAGLALGYYFFGLQAGIVLGVIFMSTSSVITSRAMSAVGELHSKAGKMITAANFSDDIISVIALSTMVGYFAFSESWKVLSVFFLLVIFMIVAVGFLAKHIGRFSKILEEMNDEQFVVALALVIIFLLAYGTQTAGIAAVVGAFAAGILLGRSELTETTIAPKIKTVAYGFFIPLFFAYAALLLEPGVQLHVIAALLLAAGAAKFIAWAAAGSYYGMRGREHFTAGIAAVPRGEMAVIAAYIALGAALISAQIYTLAIIAILLTIIATSVLFRFFVKQW